MILSNQRIWRAPDLILSLLCSGNPAALRFLLLILLLVLTVVILLTSTNCLQLNYGTYYLRQYVIETGIDPAP